MAKGYSARGGFSGSQGQMMRQQQMQQKIMQMQQQMAKAQEDVENTDFTATVGGGAVQAVVSGKKELKELVIAPDALTPDDAKMVQDMIISAVNEALRQAEEAMSKSMDGLASGLNIPGLSGLGF